MSAETYRKALEEEAARTDLSDDRRKANAAELRRLAPEAPAPELETADADEAPETATPPKARSTRKRA